MIKVTVDIWQGEPVVNIKIIFVVANILKALSWLSIWGHKHDFILHIIVCLKFNHDPIIATVLQKKVYYIEINLKVFFQQVRNCNKQISSICRIVSSIVL